MANPPVEPWQPRVYPLALGVLVATGVFALILLQRPATIQSPQEPVGSRAAEAEVRLDPNVATKAELLLLPQVGPSTADAIIAYRESRSPERAYRKLSDLTRVRGIGDATAEKLQPFLQFPERE